VSSTPRRRVLLAWSSGKDSAWALHVMRRRAEDTVVGLLTVVNRTHGRVTMHGVRNELLAAQARALGLPLWTAEIPSPCSHDEYARVMGKTLASAHVAGIDAVAFGDLFLTDVRTYREGQMRGTGLAAIFPLWGTPTRHLAGEMIDGGLRARVTCLDPRTVPRALAGRCFDWSFLAELPQGVDPCGENGEFHTFAWDGPMFRAPVAVCPGAIEEHDAFVFADLLPKGGRGQSADRLECGR
jgi:uncharacterized protein (TIGR00290 family)